MLSTTPSGGRIDYFDIEQNISLPLQWTKCNVRVYVLRMTIFAGRATGRSTSTLHRRGFLDTGRDVMEEGVAVSVTSHVTRDTSQGGGVVMSTGHCLSS